MTKEFQIYLRSLVGFAGNRGFGLIGLILLAALLEGVGLFVLVPVLEVFAGNPTSAIAVKLQSFLLQFGLTSRSHQLIVMLSIFLIIFFVRSLVIWLRDIRLVTLATEFIDHWRGRIFKALSEAPWSIVSQSSRSEVEYSIMSDVARLSIGTDRILRGTVNLFMLAAQVVIAFILSPPLAIMVLGFVFISALLFLPTFKRAEGMGQVLSWAGRDAHKALGDFFSGLKLAKAHRSEDLYVQRFRNKTTELRSSKLKFLNEQGFLRGAFEVASAALVCVVIAVGLLYLDTPLPQLLVFLLIMRRLTGPFYFFIQSVQSFANMIPAFVHLRKIETDLRSATPQKSQAPVAIIHDSDEPYKIEFENVTYRHLGAANTAFSDISLTIEPGDVVEVNGPSGAGKTTFIDLLSGLLHPDSGRVKLNGHATSESSINQRIAYVAQDSFLFDVSLRENLLWPKGDCDDGKIWKALQATNIAEKIRALPDGLESKTGERGTLLSGGERQRLCLARALLQEPKLLILDEATNAIDLNSEKALFESLKMLRGTMTIIVISHRSTDLLKADKSITINQGHIRCEDHKR